MAIPKRWGLASEGKSDSRQLALVGHSGSPQGEAQADFRTSAVPQRRVSVFYRKSTGKIVSVMYWKLGENETFSEDEIQFLTEIDNGRLDRYTGHHSVPADIAA